MSQANKQVENKTNKLTAGVILIGNELLSGRVEDKNLPYIAKKLSDRGIKVVECRIIADTPEAIIDTVNEFRKKHTYVFTTGGIGPTHDDITTRCVAKAFGVEIYRDDKTVAAFKAHYGDRATEATYRMCDFPVGADLLENSVSVAPGFRMENVYVMAGIPRVMQSMFDVALPTLEEGEPIQEVSFTAHTSEGKIGIQLEAIQNANTKVDIGSYPFLKDGKPTVTLVIRSVDQEAVHKAAHAIGQMLEDLEAEIIDAPDAWPQAAAV